MFVSYLNIDLTCWNQLLVMMFGQLSNRVRRTKAGRTRAMDDVRWMMEDG